MSGRRVVLAGLAVVLMGCASCTALPAGRGGQPGTSGQGAAGRDPESAACVDPADDAVSPGWLCDVPAVDPATLTTAQSALWSVIQHAYAAQQPGTTYAQGVDEAWCADFVSWVFNGAGYPYRNPNSGSWRIPGTSTLTEYFQSQGVFHKPDEAGFAPQLGDVAIYDKESAVWGQHTNIIIAYDGTWLVTVGGNQGHGNVTAHRHRWDDPDLHLRGIGRPLPD